MSLSFSSLSLSFSSLSLSFSSLSLSFSSLSLSFSSLCLSFSSLSLSFSSLSLSFSSLCLSNFSLAPVVPGLTADFVNVSTLRISWDAASDGQNVTGYDITVLKGNMSVSQVAADNSTSSVVVHSLDQCDNYTVKVAANSSVGPGNYSTFEFVTRCGESLVVLHFLSCHNLRASCLQTP